MPSTFMGIEIGKRGVSAHEQALNTTGHNLTNASAEGYSRQRVTLSAMNPIYVPGLNRAETAGQLGQGVLVDRVERVRDQLLDQRVVAQAGAEGYWQTRDPYLLMMDQLYMEPADNSIRSKMDAFWDAWQELATYPADSAPREAVLTRGQTLVDGIHDRYNQLKGLQDMANQDVELTVERINELSRQIASLNSEVMEVRAQGDDPNDLLDRRDLLTDQLSQLVDITVNHRDTDEFMIHSGGVVLVQGHIGRQFSLDRDLDNEGYAKITWADTGGDVALHQGGGSLAALVELRDLTIRDEIQELDTMTMNFVDLVNEVHREGYGLNGKTGLDFFTEHHFVTNVMGNYDRNGDGTYDSSYIFRMNGQNALDERAQIGLEGTITLSAPDGGTVNVGYYATDTVAELITRINNSNADVTARLNRDGVLSLRGTPSTDHQNPDFVIRHVEDSGHFLAGYAGLLNASGAEGAYDWAQADAANALRAVAQNDDTSTFSTAPIAHPSGWLTVNAALVSDKSSIAAGLGENGHAANPGNGEAALAIAAIRNSTVMVGKQGSFDDYFANAVARIGMLGEQSGRSLETQNLIMKNLKDMRASVSGVNTDEELANLIKYQQGYAASARFITTINTMLDTLLRMGA